MKIAVFIKSTTFHKGYGGLETQNKVLCQGLAKHEHKITVFSPAKEISTTVETKEVDGVTYVFIPCEYRMLFAPINKNSWYNKSYWEFLKYHQKEPFDVVISQSSAGLGIIARKPKLKLKVVGISHGTIGGEMKTLLNSVKSPLELAKAAKSLAFGVVNLCSRQRKYIHGCNSVVAVSSAVKEQLLQETSVSDKKVVVIPNGMDPLKVPQKNWGNYKKNEPFKVLYIGRIEESKGLSELLQACRDIDGIFINIVGDGPFLEELKILSRQYKMSQKILFYGKLPFEQAVEMYSCSDVFVLPTKRVEGFPMTLVEACFAGIPIIATNIGGNKDAVKNGVNGFLLDKLNATSLQEKITKLAKDLTLTEKMGLNGRMSAEENFTLEKMVNSYERIL